MAEPFFRMMEVLVPSIVAANGNKITYYGLENIPDRGGALIALNHTSYVDWVPASIAAKERKRRLRFMIKAEMQEVRSVNYVIKHA
ncbi:1-acyl-sn-glycerol-3-phosphate acyltransferase, partial [Mycolicibacterium setense]